MRQILKVIFVIFASAAPLMVRVPSAGAAEPFESVKPHKQPPGFSSLDISSSAAGIAMGAACVADPYRVTSFRSNPAAFSDEPGVKGYYSRRFMDYLDSNRSMIYGQEACLYSTGAVINLGRVGLALDYTRLEQGRFESVSTIYTPQGALEGVFEPYWHTMTAALAADIYGGLKAGAAIKYHNRNYLPGYDYEGAYLFDLGIIYGLNGFFDRTTFNDHFCLGLSVQNTGGKLSYSNLGEIELPRFLRLGFSYQLARRVESDEEMLRLLFAGEYRRYLNYDDREDDFDRDYYGFGIEGRLYQWAYLRVGGGNDPVWGVENRFNPALGAGADIPFSGFGIDVPVDLKFDYTYLFLEDSEYDNIISVSIGYNRSLI
ncbi:MAG: hypothetical protein GF417_08375 [Candidatus Latescibacteria bacterium]|nr:hypothetical protein [bacterium]MBD3424437.1 hypothetical protein [Candidatus Latescibacterota bacterium]